MSFQFVAMDPEGMDTEWSYCLVGTSLYIIQTRPIEVKSQARAGNNFGAIFCLLAPASVQNSLFQKHFANFFPKKFMIFTIETRTHVGDPYLSSPPPPPH